MRYLFCTFFKILVCSTSFGQYDTIIKSLVETPSNCPQRLNGSFKKNKEIQSGEKIEYYKFSKSKTDFCYYPKQANINCGYFRLFGKVFALNDKFENNLSCDFDYGSFELYRYSLNKRNYLILNAIRYGSGTTTRFVYCNLFDITNKDSIIYYPLASIYGSGFSFGDYNNDGRLDFLQIEYDKSSKSVDDFVMKMRTLNESNQVFDLVEGKYITFSRQYRNDNSFVILKTKTDW
ncbi:MAG: hypothetical protein HC867_00320 [Bacteroidia bacterium]|nr:hypothetical protein [Bacteroidia bacterium]